MEVLVESLNFPAHSPSIPVIIDVVRSPAACSSVTFCSINEVGVVEDKLVLGSLVRVLDSDVVLFVSHVVGDLEDLDLLVRVVMPGAVCFLELHCHSGVSVVMPMHSVGFDLMIVARFEADPVRNILLVVNVVVVSHRGVEVISSPANAAIVPGCLSHGAYRIGILRKLGCAIEIEPGVVATRNVESVLAGLRSLEPALGVGVGSGVVSVVVFPVGEELCSHILLINLGWVTPLPVGVGS